MYGTSEEGRSRPKENQEPIKKRAHLAYRSTIHDIQSFGCPEEIKRKNDMSRVRRKANAKTHDCLGSVPSVLSYGRTWVTD